MSAHDFPPELILVSARPWTAPRLVFFDLDGVLTLEKEYFERSWALLLRRLTERDMSVTFGDLTDDDVVGGALFRQETKGSLPAVRIEKMRNRVASLSPGESLPPLQACLHLWIDSIREQQLAEYGPGNPGGLTFEDYLIDGARQLLEYLSERPQHVHIVTANVQSQATWIAERVGISDLLDGVIGYPDLPTESQLSKTKATILADTISKHGCEAHEAVFIGDGYSDIRFGRQASVPTLGIANDAANRKKLLREKPDYLVQDTATLCRLKEMLFA